MRVLFRKLVGFGGSCSCCGLGVHRHDRIAVYIAEDGANRCIVLCHACARAIALVMPGPEIACTRCGAVGRIAAEPRGWCECSICGRSAAESVRLATGCDCGERLICSGCAERIGRVAFQVEDSSKVARPGFELWGPKVQSAGGAS